MIKNRKELRPRTTGPQTERDDGASAQNCTGTVAGLSAKDGLLVDYPGNARGPLPAASLLPLSPAEIRALAFSAQAVLLTFDGGRPDRPILLGLLHRPSLMSPSTNGDAAAAPLPAVRLRAVVDGREVVLHGTESIELRCGKASITLTKAGKIVIKGEYISSRSRGAQRIRGGSVRIN